MFDGISVESLSYCQPKPENFFYLAANTRIFVLERFENP